MTPARDQRKDQEDGEWPFDLSLALSQARQLTALHQKNVHGAFAGGYRSVFKGSGIEFDEVREYVEGDDPRSVDWQITARMGRPFIKRFVEEREQTVGFLVDAQPSVRCGLGPYSTREMQARLLSVLALTAAQNDDKTALVRYGNSGLDPVDGARGLDHALRLARHILDEDDDVELNATEAGQAPRLVEAVDHAIRHWRVRSLVILCSDFVEVPDESTREAIFRARQHFDLRVLQVVPPELATSIDDSAECTGWQTLRDPSRGSTLSVDWSNGAVRDHYHQRLNAWRRSLEEVWMSAGVSCTRALSPTEKGSAADSSTLEVLQQLYRARAGNLGGVST
ncbi:MAG: DUF58 domain-containing protein [Planctomycetota bacterium]